jgi:hypothetical protein
MTVNVQKERKKVAAEQKSSTNADEEDIEDRKTEGTIIESKHREDVQAPIGESWQ